MRQPRGRPAVTVRHSWTTVRRYGTDAYQAVPAPSESHPHRLGLCAAVWAILGPSVAYPPKSGQVLGWHDESRVFGVDSQMRQR
jgi:hypothetical protein